MNTIIYAVGLLALAVSEAEFIGEEHDDDKIDCTTLTWRETGGCRNSCAVKSRTLRYGQSKERVKPRSAQDVCTTDDSSA